MKIRKKITLFYTIITFGVLLAVFVFVYFFTIRAIDKNFDTYLLEKAYITAQKHFEQDEVSQQVYENILKDYSLLLPGAKEVILDINQPHAKDSLAAYLSPEKVKALYLKKDITFKNNKLQSVGIYYSDNQGDFVILIIAENPQGSYIARTLFIILSIVLLSAILFVWFIGWGYAGQILFPLKHILKTVKTIESNNLHSRLEERKGSDELSELVRLLNQMLERLELSFQSQKMFISNASHELNTPLTAIMGECEVMQLQAYSNEEYQAALQRIETESQRLRNLILHLLKLAQTDLDISFLFTEDILLWNCLEKVVAYFENTKYAERINLQNISVAETKPVFIVKANSDMLTIAFQNMIENACKYSGNKPVIISYEEISKSCNITIKDQGIGIPANELAYVFEPFYRGKNTYNYVGFGVGLALSKRIVDLSGGTLKIISEQEKMTQVTVSWK